MHYALTQIRESFNSASDDGSLISRYLFRPISFYLTFLLLNLGLRKPNHATALSLLSGIISSIFFLIGQKTFFCWGVFFYLSFWILDYTDGNIARVTDSATYFGKFLDGATDTLIETLLPLSLSLGLYFISRYKLFLFTGIILAVLFLFVSFLINRLAFFNRWLRMDKYSDNSISKSNYPQNLNPLKSNVLPLNKIYNITTDVKIMTLLVASVIGMTRFLFLLFSISIAVWTLSTAVATILDAAKQLNVHRVSKRDSRLEHNSKE